MCFVLSRRDGDSVHLLFLRKAKLNRRHPNWIKGNGIISTYSVGQKFSFTAWS